MPVRDVDIDRDPGDLAAIDKFAPPDGRLLLACVDDLADRAVGIACLQRIGPETAEVKRM
jgi:hypothetical protein